MPLNRLKSSRKCRKCGGGTFYIKEEGIFKCWVCGFEMAEKWRRHRYLESHRLEILADVLAIGPEETRIKWKLPPLTWRTLKDRWGLRRIWWAPGMPFPSAGGLPELPQWRNAWPDEFKRQWLELHTLIIRYKLRELEEERSKPKPEADQKDEEA